MRFSLRAAAVAAVALPLCAVAGLTAPSLASEADTAPTTAYIEHASLEMPAADLGLNAPADAADAGETPTSLQNDLPVATHAMAPVLPTVEAPARGERSLADLVRDHHGTDTADADADCLARAVYYESKGEPYAGQLSVAEVIINRAESGRFPSSICGVVRQAGQFSFVRRGVIPTPPQQSRDWAIAQAITHIALQDLADGEAPRALFFHARRVNPGWRLTRVATVGNHVFYR